MGLVNYHYSVEPLSASSVYTSVSLLRMIDGLEVAGVSQMSLKSNEDTHLGDAIYVQFIPGIIPNPAVIPSLKWLC